MSIACQVGAVVLIPLLVLGCSQKAADPVEEVPDDTDSPEILISDPWEAGRLPGPLAATDAAGPLTFVSLPPGTEPDAQRAVIRNLNAEGDAGREVPLVQGGFDPVAVVARAGDRVEIALRRGDTVVRRLYARVPPSRPPVIVRLIPPGGRTDVALVMQPEVVFSEPMDPTTFADAVRLLLDDVPVAGALAPTARWIAQFRPAAPLASLTAYTLEVAATVRDDDGEALAGGIRSTFTTGTPSTLPPPTEPPPPAAPPPPPSTPSPSFPPVTATPQVPIPFEGTYERESPHRNAAVRNSRLAIRANGTFDLQLETAAGTAVHTGRWAGHESVNLSIVLTFDASGTHCGDGIGIGSIDATANILAGDRLGISFCGPSNLESGIYALTPDPRISGAPPPTGGEIAFVRNGVIYRANSDGSSAVPLSAGPVDGEPAWSPDGRKLAFRRGLPGQGRVFIMDADGANAVEFAAFPQGGEASSPTWSPDGAWIAYSCRAEFTGFNTEICRQPAGTPGAVPVQVTAQRGATFFPSWSPDGTRIAFTSDYTAYDFTWDVWVVQLDDLRATPLTNYFSAGYELQNGPVWSPDGRRLAYMECPWAFVGCTIGSLVVINADGSGLTRLLATSDGWNPAWSPDGQVIAFSSLAGIEWVSADGTRRGLILDDGHHPAWRPRVP